MTSTLLPVLVNIPCCFVNIPVPFIETRLGSISVATHGAVAIELQWENEFGFNKCHVGWVGGVSSDIDSIELSVELAKCVGLFESLQANPQMRVLVIPLINTPIAERLQIEPCSPDDWEIIEVNAGFIETQLLRQISVVSAGQRIPIWIQNATTIVYADVILQDTPECVRLGQTTEVEVIPVTRVPEVTPGELFHASRSFRIQPFSCSRDSIIHNFGRNVQHKISQCRSERIGYLHPSDIITLHGLDVYLRKNEPLLVTVWSDEDAKAEEATYITGEAEETTSHRPTDVIRLIASRKVVPGHLVINDRIKEHLNVKDLSLLRMRVVSIPPKPIVGITLVSSFATGDGSLISNFFKWCSTFEFLLPISQKVVVDLEGEACIIDVETVNDGEPMEATLIGMNPEYFVLRPGLDPSTLLVRENFKANIPDIPMAISPLGYFSGMKPAVREIQSFVSPIVFRRNAAVRLLLGTPEPGGVLVVGQTGCGKSSLLNVVCSGYRNHYGSLAYSVIVSCRSLRGIKMSALKEAIELYFEEARRHAPSIIVFDDIDALVPAETDAPGAPNDQSEHIAEFLCQQIELLRREKVLKESKILRNTEALEQTDDLAASLALEQAAVYSAVAVIASAKSLESVHERIRSCGLIDHCVAVPALTAEVRKEIIVSLFQQTSKIVHCDTSGLADDTEGYSMKDLDSLIHLVDHYSTLRNLKQRYTLGPSLTNEEDIVDDDITQALAEFCPSALSGADLFKSDVTWGDVGGLSHVRKVLREALEFPTRYSRLYELAPIKLPSGLLLFGPPGCGKTLLAGAVAHECGLNFISVKGPEILDKYIGASEQAVRDLFQRAALAAPCVLFLDEFDSIAPRRGADNTGVTDRVVNQLLTFLDGVESRTGVYVLAATSRPDLIDPALLRPGRLDKSLYCGFPDVSDRLSILEVVASKLQLTEEANDYLAVIANSKTSSDFTGADLQALLYSAQLEAVHASLDQANPNCAASVPIIQTHHLKAAILSTRPSVPLSERLRYDRIYASFKDERAADFVAASSEFSTIQRTALA